MEAASGFRAQLEGARAGDEPALTASACCRCGRNEKVARALGRITALSHLDADVILLRVVKGFTLEEVALLHRPTSTVRSIQERAIRRHVRSAREAA